jgi:xylose isomerase
VNDNYRDWDHDLIVGSVCFWETLEFYFWLRRSGYRGWHVLDIFPYREDGSAALQEGVRRVEYFLRAAEELDGQGLLERIRRGDSVESQAALWSSVLKERPD